MHEAERDRARQAEDVATGEVGELLRERPALEELLELGAELGVDDGHQEAPDPEPGADQDRSERERAPRSAEQTPFIVGPGGRRHSLRAGIDVQARARLPTGRPGRSA